MSENYQEGTVEEESSSTKVQSEESLSSKETGPKATKIVEVILGTLAIFLIILTVYIFSGGSLTEEEKMVILTAPQAGEEKAYNKLIEKYAIASSTLTVGANCEMNPLIIKFSEEDTLIIKNNDTKIHTIQFEDQDFFMISPGRERQISVKDVFRKENGIYRYKCSELETENNTGVMYIIK